MILHFFGLLAGMIIAWGYYYFTRPIENWERNLYFCYVKAMMRQAELFNEKGEWHVDECNCKECKVIEKWIKLSWFDKLRIKAQS